MLPQFDPGMRMIAPSRKVRQRVPSADGKHRARRKIDANANHVGRIDIAESQRSTRRSERYDIVI